MVELSEVQENVIIQEIVTPNGSAASVTTTTITTKIEEEEDDNQWEEEEDEEDDDEEEEATLIVTQGAGKQEKERAAAAQQLVKKDDKDKVEEEEEEDFDSVLDESVLERLIALKDIIPPHTRAHIKVAAVNTFDFAFGVSRLIGSGMWILATGALLVILPISLELERDAMALSPGAA